MKNRCFKYFLFCIFFPAGALILFIPAACKKDSDTPISKDSIDNSDKYISKPDTLIYPDGYNVTNTYQFDVDNDHINDFEISSSLNHLVTVYTYGQVDISCLNSESYLNTSEQSDTTFFHFQWDTIYSTGGNTEYIQIKTIGPNRHSLVDSVKEVHLNVHVNNYARNDFSSFKNNWTNGTCMLIKQGYWVYFMDFVKGDNWLWHEDVYFDSNYLLPNNHISYIGIKKVKNGVSKFGWIKLLVIDDYKITLLETALEK